MSDPRYRQGEFYWCELATTDAAKAKAFYTQLFGWSATDQPMPGDSGTYTLLDVGGQQVGGLYQMGAEEAQQMPSHWGHYIAADDVDATYAKALAAGANEMAGPMDIPGIGRMAVIQDPTGAVISLMRGSEHSGRDRMDGAAGSFSWFELVTPDAPKAKAFYTDVIGYGTDKMDMGEGREYTMFKVGDDSVAGVFPMGEDMTGVPPHWMGYVTVTDCDATTAKATELGASTVVPPTDVPGVGRFAMIQDPTGGMVSFIAYFPPS